MERTDRDADLEQLTAALARGDNDAWTRFHREFGPAIFRQLLATAWGDHDAATEALQKTYLRVARHVRTCASPAMFRGWLRVVARTALHDLWRRRRCQSSLLERHRNQPPDLPDDEKAEDRLHVALDIALATLSAEERDLLRAKYFSGASVRDIAERDGLSEKAVESRLTRTRATLRTQLLAALSADE
jgi:RNA polymerase sigma factor (sigma-70 family)